MRHHFGQYWVEVRCQEQSRYCQCAEKQAGIPENPQHAQIPRAHETGGRAATANACMNITIS